MNLLLLHPSDQTGESQYRIADARLKHLIEVLKLAPGDTIDIGLLNGPIGLGEIECITPQQALVRVVALQEPPAIPADIDIILAIPRPKTLRKVLVTCAMMGVRSLHLTRANRTEKSYLLSPLLQPEEYEPYLLDGLAQGKLTRLPKVEIHSLFRPFVEDVLPTLPDYTDACKLLSDLLPAGRLDSVIKGAFPKNVMLAIGPEGGWVPFERNLLHSAGFTPFNLGPWVLRVETALATSLGQIELLRAMRASS